MFMWTVGCWSFIKTAGTNPVSHLLIFQGPQQIHFTIPKHFQTASMIETIYSDIFHQSTCINVACSPCKQPTRQKACVKQTQLLNAEC